MTKMLPEVYELNVTKVICGENCENYQQEIITHTYITEDYK